MFYNYQNFFSKEGVTAKQIIDNYADYIETVVKILRTDLKQENPIDRYDLHNLCTAICSIVWSNTLQYPSLRKFIPYSTTLLSDSFASKGAGTLDCDTSSHIFADILNQFGISSNLVDLPGHVILHVIGPDASFYLETTSQCNVVIHDSLELLKARYPTIDGEYKFSAINNVTYMARGNARFNLGDYQGANADFTAIITRDPKNIDAYVNRGNAKDRLKDYTGAIADYTKAIELTPDYSSYYNRAGTYMSVGNLGAETGDQAAAKKYYDLAISDCNKAIGLDPNNGDAYRSRGDAKCKLKDYKGAIADYSKAIRLNKQTMQRDPENAQKYRRKNASAYYDLGNIKFDLGDYSGAIADFNEAIKQDSFYANLTFLLSEAYAKRGELNKEIGKVKTRKGNYVDAKKYYEKAISDYDNSIKQGSTYLCSDRGVINALIGDLEAGRGDQEAAKKYYNLAISDFNKAILQGATYLYADRGTVKYKLKDYKGAIVDFSEAIKKEPMYSSDAYFGRANAKYALGNPHGAIADLSIAIKDNQWFSEAYYLRGTIKYGLKDYKGAITDFSAAIKYNRQYTEAYFNRGNAYYELAKKELRDTEDVAKAIADYNKALTLDPAHKWKYYNAMSKARGLIAIYK